MTLTMTNATSNINSYIKNCLTESFDLILTMGQKFAELET